MTATPSGTLTTLEAPEPPPATPEEALRAGKPPVGTGASPLFAQLIALGFVASAVVAVQHLLVALGAITGTSWLSTTVEAVDGLKGDSPVVLVVGVVALVLGVLLVPVVLKPRPRKGVAVQATTGVHLRPRDLRRIVEATLEGTDTITSTTVKATRRKVKVAAASVAEKSRNPEITSEVGERLEPVLAALERRPRVKITVRNESI